MVDSMPIRAYKVNGRPSLWPGFEKTTAIVICDFRYAAYSRSLVLSDKQNFNIQIQIFSTFMVLQKNFKATGYQGTY